MDRDRAELPAGVVTFLFTDIEGSTRRLQRHGEIAYGQVADRHDAVLAAAWVRHGGVQFGSEGDACFVAFTDAAEALAAAVDAQRELTALAWPDGGPVRVRIGIHSGFAKPVDADYRALAVNQTARVVSCAHGGQTLVTAHTYELTAGIPSGVRVGSLGRFRVRDFDEPVELLAVAAADLPTVDAAPRVRPAENHNIVPPTTPLIGRQRELAELADRLRPGVFASLVGPGGVGKTRLALEAALAAVDDWADGVWFVDLAPVGDPAELPTVIGSALGATLAGDAEPLAELLAHLRDRTSLVVLDNCEHLIDGAAATIATLHREARSIAVLTTSRRAVGLRDEYVVRVEPLSTAEADGDAVALFLDRAASVGAEPRPADVAALCVELDGLPLAIELAAARAAVASPAEIVRQLRDAPGAIRSRDPTLPERQRSLDRLLDWSERLLTDVERAVLRRLSVFATGFDLELAAEVCTLDGVERVDVAEAVWDLADVSLLRLDPAAGETRYRLLATVRAFAQSRCDPAERDGVARRLADALLDRFGPHRSIDRTWLSRVALELDNIRHTIGVLAAADTADPAAAQTLAWIVGRYHDEASSARPGVDELERWLGELGAVTAERVAMLTLAADLHLRIGDVVAAERRVGEAEAIVATTGVPSWDQAGLVRVRADIAIRQDEPAAAVEMVDHALRVVSDQRARCRLLNIASIARFVLDDLDGAVASNRAEIVAAEAAGMDGWVANSHNNLAEMLLRSGDERGAAEHQLAAMEYARAGGVMAIVAFSVIVAAHLGATRGEWERAVRLHHAANRQLAEMSYRLYEVDAERSRRLDADARRELGDAAYEAARADGLALGIDGAADDATIVLESVATATEHRQQEVPG